MKRTLARAIGCVSLLPAAGASLAQPAFREWNDAVGDAVVRRTDPGNDGAINPAATLPDLRSAKLGVWSPSNPTSDPSSAFVGTYTAAAGMHILRMDLVFAGLVNPPGPLALGGPWYDPFLFGNSPLMGHLEIDVDGDADTGGELGGIAMSRYLANVARFGARPRGLIGGRAATSGADYDFDFYSPPQFERSGSDFALVLCGCETPTIVLEVGNIDGVFEPGETWIVRGRFFQRAGGYDEASAMFGGSHFGAYDPLVNLMFAHNPVVNQTTVSLVFPLTMQGAAILAGHPVQPRDYTFDNGNDFSVEEALWDVVEGAEGALFGPVYDLAHRWAGRNPGDYLDPRGWQIAGLFGTAYQNQEFGALYVWTDTGFGETVGDVTGDGLVNQDDRDAVQVVIALLDGTGADADGEVNGSVALPNFAWNFSLYDVNGDGLIDEGDYDQKPPCSADWDHENGVNSNDFFTFLQDFFAGDADFNGDGVTDSRDLFEFLAAFLAGC